MAIRALRFVPAFILLSFCSTAFSQEFPNIEKIDFAYYQTEVQITDVKQATSAYATEYYNSVEQQGALKIYFQGDQQLVYYDNSSSQITEIKGPNCTAWDIDLSDYDYTPLYYGWLNQEPIIIGPSAPLWYAQERIKEAKFVEQTFARSINCDKFVLPVQNKYDNLTYEYYFARESWTTPYKYQDLRVPIRIRIVGTSSRYSAAGTYVEVEQVNDFAYFKPSIDDMNNLLPPIGIGCKLKQKTTYMPPTPDVFQYSAEFVDFLEAKEHADVEVQFQKTWFDSTRLLARRYTYSRKKGFRSNLYDFNSGVLYKISDGGSCELAPLRDTDFQKFDYGLTSTMKTAKEALNLDGEFYEMGKREIRGLKCDVFESVQFDKHFKGKFYYKLVVTAYFTDSETNIAVNGEMESRIPVYYIITGYDTPEKKTLQVQYNIFAFDDVVWPEMYSTFRLDRCYPKADDRAYFVLILPVKAEDAAKMEDQDEMIITRLRSTISEYAKVPEMRIPYLKADYKPTGVFITGIILERPPALLNFYYIDTGPTVTRDPDLKVIPEAENLEECSFACVDEKKFPCKGFYFCGRACFIKSDDPADVEDGKSQDLGECAEYIRTEIDSTTFRQSYLVDAVGYLEEAVLARNVTVPFKIPNGEEIVIVQDIVIGDGPTTGSDGGRDPITLSVGLRKLNSNFETTKNMDYVGSLHDCYKRCKETGSQCSSFSYCPDSKKDDKECMITSELVVKGVTKDTDLVEDKNCNIYSVKFAELFIPYPEKVSLLPGDKVINSVPDLENCAQSCRMEKGFTCRGFEYCRAKKICTLHEKHILDLKPGESGTSGGSECTHYAARYIVDYTNLGGVLIDDTTNVKYGTSLEECAQICSEDLKADCKSFNYCQKDDELMTADTDNRCELSSKMLTDDIVTTTEKKGCMHYEKRKSVNDLENSKPKLKPSGYTKKGFTGLVIGMIALGIIVGALGFILYSWMRSRGSR